MKTINSTAFRNQSHWLIIPALYLASRVLLLFFSPHSIYRFEELYQGYLGMEFMEGHLKTSFWSYQIDPYTGGSLVVGVLAALSFKLFGTHLFALKLVPLLFSFLTLLAGMGFLQRFFGRKEAIAGGLLLTFPAPALASLSVSALGSHPESRLFSMGIIWAFYEIAFIHPVRRRAAFSLGLLSAIGLWFSLLNAIVILTGAITFGVLRPRPVITPRLLLSLVAGAALGSVPWLAYNLVSKFSTIAYFQDFCSGIQFVSLPHFFLSWSLEIVRLFLSEIPASLSLFLNHRIWDHLFSILYCFIILSFLLSLADRSLPASLRDTEEESLAPQLRDRLLFFIIFPCIFLLGISFISLTMAWHGEMLPYRFRYFAFFYLYLCLLGAILGTKKERVANALLIGMMLMGIIGLTALLRPQNAGRLMRVPGYSIEPVRRLWSSTYFSHSIWAHKTWEELTADENLFLKAVHDPTFWTNFEWNQYIDEIHNLPPRLHYYFIMNLGSETAASLLPQDVAIPNWLTDLEKDMYYAGFARGLDWETLFTTPDVLNSFYQIMPERGRLWFVFVFARNAFVWNPGNYEYELAADEIQSFISGISLYKKWLYRGIGAAFLRHFPNLYPLEENSEAILKTIPEKFHQDFWWGLGWNLRGRIGVNDAVWLEEQIKNLNREAQSHLRQGFEAYQKQWYENSPVAS